MWIFFLLFFGAVMIPFICNLNFKVDIAKPPGGKKTSTPKEAESLWETLKREEEKKKRSVTSEEEEEKKDKVLEDEPKPLVLSHL